jgi:hypothetical protein
VNFNFTGDILIRVPTVGSAVVLSKPLLEHTLRKREQSELQADLSTPPVAARACPSGSPIGHRRGGRVGGQIDSGYASAM